MNRRNIPARIKYLNKLYQIHCAERKLDFVPFSTLTKAEAWYRSVSQSLRFDLRTNLKLMEATQ